MPWFDSLVQPEIYNAMAAMRRTERLDPTLEDLLEESKYLFRAVRDGVRRARVWFDSFEASFGESQSAGTQSPAEQKGQQCNPQPHSGINP